MQSNYPKLPYAASALQPWISERHWWWRKPYSSVRVENGLVHYSGIIDSPDAQTWRDAARVTAENLAGWRGVENHRFTMIDIPSMV